MAGRGQQRPYRDVADSGRSMALVTRCSLSRRQMDALQETHQARGPLLLRVAFALRDLWNGSQRSGSFVARKMRSIRTPLLLERSGRQARKGT
jgi:hypothetical protein